MNKNTQIPILLDTVKSIVSMLDLQELLNTILIELANLIRYSAAAVFIIEDNLLNLQAYQGPPLFRGSAVVLSPKDRYHEIHRLVSSKYSSFIRNINEIPGLLVEISGILNLDIKNLKRFLSWLFLPMFINEDQIGIMVLAFHEEDHYDHESLRIGQLFANYAAIAIQNAHLYELSQNVGILKERNRLSYELHDSIAQTLYSISLYANAIQRAIESGKISLANEHSLELQHLSSGAVKDMRLMIFELRQQLLEELGLEMSIRARFEAVEEKAGIKTTLKVEGNLDLPKMTERGVNRIIQELLNYIEKISQTKEITLQIKGGENQIHLEIFCDKNVNINLTSENDEAKIYYKITQRINKIGGCFQVENSPDQGTRYVFDLNL
ncbi:MAG: histidine kinase [Chloroflexota bacterium]|nr:histidine kinase [Chloroflexota bacterium]